MNKMLFLKMLWCIGGIHYFGVSCLQCIFYQLPICQLL